MKEGPLDKLGHLVKNWKNRFFVLETRVNGTNIDPWIVYYRGSGVGKSEGAKGQLCLVGAKVFRPAQVRDSKIILSNEILSWSSLMGSLSFC